MATGREFCLARYNSDGSLDTSFDTDGIVTTPVGPAGGSDSARSVAVQADGRIITTGDCDTGGATGIDICLVQYDEGGLVSQYADTTSDWDTVGTSLFGACLRSVGAATATWTANAGCPATDGAYWNAVPTSGSQVATANPLSTTSTANLRFGLRTTAGQPAGAYLAPITFDVVAP